jgi:hypothetical protein
MIYPKSAFFEKDMRDSFRQWAYIHLISAKEPTGFLQVKGWEGLPEAKEFDITLTIEGVEVDFIGLLDRLESEFDRKKSKWNDKVNYAAHTLVEDVLERFGEKLKDCLDEESESD